MLISINTCCTTLNEYGHVHLYAADMYASMRFYHDVLGFKIVSLVPNFRIGDVSVNGKQVHTIAFNTWMGEGAPPPPANALGMRYFTIVLPNTTELEQVVARVQQAGGATEQTEQGILVHDPSQRGVVLATAPNS